MVNILQEYNDDLIEKIIIDRNEQKNSGFRKYLVYLKTFLTHNIGDPYLYIWAYNIRTKRLARDYDQITLIVGKEGTGKSTLAAKLAVLVDPEFNMDRVCYSENDFLRAAKVAKKGDTIWIDEGAMFLFSREAMSGITRKIIQFLTTCRQLNLHIIICIPNFFTVDTYVREHRVHGLFIVMDRGKYKYVKSKGDAILKVAVYGKRGKNVLSDDIFLKKEEYTYGVFNSYLPNSLGDFNKASYLSCKHESLMKQLSDMEEKLNTVEHISDLNNDDVGFVDVANFSSLSGLHPNTIIRNIKQGKLKGKKMGSKFVVSRGELDVN